jgi:hypothetical protein
MIGKTTAWVVRILAIAGFLFLVPGLAEAQIDFGVRGGLYSDADAGFLGAELLVPITREWFFNPNYEYVFVDNGDLSTLNLDVHYDVLRGRPYYAWLGGGAAVIFSKDEVLGCRNCRSDSSTDLGLNLLAGLGFGRGQAIRPYVQGKVTISDNTEASVAVGLRFY